MAKLDAFFKSIVETGASDMHLTVGSPPILRISGHLTPIEYADMTEEVLRPLIYEILTERQIEEFEKNWDIDFAYSAPNIARFRCNVFINRLGIAAAFRMIPFEMPSLDELGSPPIFKDLCDRKSGLVLVTGPTGSGKSTTMAAMINYINESRAEHIITLEDPLEFIHQTKNGVISQREIGTHCKSFAQGLRAALREDPDVVLVGEMRDLETIQLAITAAETGHLVFGTLHTRSAAKTVDRIIDVFPTDRQEQIRAMLAESLQGVISQALLRRADGMGRVAAFEILTFTQGIASLIRDKKSHQILSVMQTGKKEGMQTMDQHLVMLVDQKLITQSEAEKYAENPNLFTRRSAAVAVQTS